ncbi:MAG: hypothetical protein WD894_21575 [Pirellulales bacterium]
MPNAQQSYLNNLSSEFGRGWNRFWFTPAAAAPLGLIRLVFGLIALWWYLSYIPDLAFFFGPQGIINSPTVEQWRGPYPVFSIFDWPQTAASLWFTYWLGLVVLVLFAAGLFSRITSVAALLVVVSLIHRGPMLAQPMEDVLAMVMLYLCFGPSGAAFSLDRVWKRRTTSRLEDNIAAPPSIGANISLRLIQIHLALLHFGMAIGQLRDDSWWMGRAIWGFISKPESGYVDLTWLSDHLYLLNLWTHGIVVFEFAFALLIWNRLARPILMAAAVLVWGSIGLVSGMLAFTLVMLGATLAFMPAEWLARRRSHEAL